MKSYVADNVTYHHVAGHASFGRDTLGVSIFVGGSEGDLNAVPPIPRTEIQLSEKEIRYVQNQCSDIVEGLFRLRAERALKEDPEIIAIHDEIVQKLTACFPSPAVYVQEIPNGYCKQYCCIHKPWLIVTTARGPITIGWRKRVINIDWSNSEIKTTANDLFPDENVTKDGCLIHAWSYDDAKKYLKAVLES
jgi:hypothetical protein